jgi:hypothetical protein
MDEVIQEIKKLTVHMQTMHVHQEQQTVQSTHLTEQLTQAHQQI